VGTHVRCDGGPLQGVGTLFVCRTNEHRWRLAPMWGPVKRHLFVTHFFFVAFPDVARSNTSAGSGGPAVRARSQPVGCTQETWR
jgi:hypothetical protein